MRILLSCLQSLKRHPLPAYGHWRNYFVEGLLEAGHEVVEVPNVDWAEGITYSPGRTLESWRARTWEAVEAFVRQEITHRPIHLFVGYFYPNQVEAAAIRELQRIGIPCVNFFCDNVREFVKPPAEYTAFALHWVPEFEALPMYTESGPAVYPRADAMLDFSGPKKSPRLETEPATFLGSADILRRDLLGRALQGGADFVVRGPGWLGNEDTANGSQQALTVASVVRNQVDLVRQRGFGGLLRKLSPACGLCAHRRSEESKLAQPFSMPTTFASPERQ